MPVRTEKTAIRDGGRSWSRPAANRAARGDTPAAPSRKPIWSCYWRAPVRADGETRGGRRRTRGQSVKTLRARRELVRCHGFPIVAGLAPDADSPAIRAVQLHGAAARRSDAYRTLRRATILGADSAHADREAVTNFGLRKVSNSNRTPAAQRQLFCRALYGNCVCSSTYRRESGCTMGGWGSPAA
jgi:hypothetical protein